METRHFIEKKKILQRNEEGKKISCRAFRKEKNILPTRLLEKKTCRPEITPPPFPQEINGRPLITLIVHAGIENRRLLVSITTAAVIKCLMKSYKRILAIHLWLLLLKIFSLSWQLGLAIYFFY